jgi:hypothetical protein
MKKHFRIYLPKDKHDTCMCVFIYFRKFTKYRLLIFQQKDQKSQPPDS